MSTSNINVFLLIHIISYIVCVCVRACMRACERARVRRCVCVDYACDLLPS